MACMTILTILVRLPWTWLVHHRRGAWNDIRHREEGKARGGACRRLQRIGGKLVRRRRGGLDHDWGRELHVELGKWQE